MVPISSAAMVRWRCALWAHPDHSLRRRALPWAHGLLAAGRIGRGFAGECLRLATRTTRRSGRRRSTIGMLAFEQLCSDFNAARRCHAAAAFRQAPSIAVVERRFQRRCTEPHAGRPAPPARLGPEQVEQRRGVLGRVVTHQQRQGGKSAMIVAGRQPSRSTSDTCRSSARRRMAGAPRSSMKIVSGSRARSRRRSTRAERQAGFAPRPDRRPASDRPADARALPECLWAATRLRPSISTLSTRSPSAGSRIARSATGSASPRSRPNATANRAAPMRPAPSAAPADAQSVQPQRAARAARPRRFDRRCAAAARFPRGGAADGRGAGDVVQESHAAFSTIQRAPGGETDAAVARDVGHQRGRRHARLGVDFQQDHPPGLAAGVVIAQIGAAHAAAAQRLMRAQRRYRSAAA